MSGWPEVELGEICEFKYGKSLPAEARDGGPFPVYGSNGVVGSHSAAITGAPVVIIGRKGSFGEIEYSTSPCWPIDTTYFVDSAATKTDLKWLSYRLRGLGLTTLNRAAAIPGLNREDAYRQRLLLPPLDEQRRIAAILDQAGALRAKRRQVLAHLDALTQAIFHDMFDGRQTKTTLLGDVAEVVSGITKGRRTVDPTQPFPYLAVANVQAGHLKLDTVKTIDATDSEVSRFALRTGDLVLTEGGDPDKLGRGTVWRGEITTCLHQNHVFRVRLNRDSQVLPEYLSAFLAGREAKSYFLRSAKQTTGIASINMTQLKGLSIVVPPLMDQSRYVERIANINSCVDRAKESLTMHDRLFSALQSRAFRGEL